LLCTDAIDDVRAVDVTSKYNPSKVADDPWLSLEASAQLAGNLHTATLRRAIKANRLRAVRINGGRVFRLRESWVHGWLLGGTE